jgi:hypothetical protein
LSAVRSGQCSGWCFRVDGYHGMRMTRFRREVQERCPRMCMHSESMRLKPRTSSTTCRANRAHEAPVSNHLKIWIDRWKNSMIEQTNIPKKVISAKATIHRKALRRVFAPHFPGSPNHQHASHAVTAKKRGKRSVRFGIQASNFNVRSGRVAGGKVRAKNTSVQHSCPFQCRLDQPCERA